MVPLSSKTWWGAPETQEVQCRADGKGAGQLRSARVTNAIVTAQWQQRQSVGGLLLDQGLS